MFKYKIKVIGWKYHVYRRKHWFGLWQESPLSYPSITAAINAIKLLNGES